MDKAPTDERTRWVWRIRLAGSYTRQGLPLYNQADDIIVYMRKEGHRPDHKHFVMRVPGRGPEIEAGDDLQVLIDRCLTKGDLLRHVDHIIDNYLVRLRSKILQEADLQTYALSR